MVRHEAEEVGRDFTQPLCNEKSVSFIMKVTSSHFVLKERGK